MKTLLILENDVSLSSSILRFKRQFEDNNEGCAIIEFTMLQTKTRDDIITAFMIATDILVETQFVSGSDYQLIQFASILAKMESKNVFIQNSNIKSEFEKHLEDEELYSIKHHNIYKIYGTYEEPELITFPEAIKKHEDFLEMERIKAETLAQYKDEAKSSPTGIKVRILACNANGAEFKSLQIGSTVDTLDCSKFDPNSSRGVWVWGLTEPVKLINDCGLQEYEIINTDLTTSDKLNLSFRHCGINMDDFSDIELRGLIHVYDDDEYGNLEKAQVFCDFVKIERRSNRRMIANILA